jgi:hypothetical protein
VGVQSAMAPQGTAPLRCASTLTPPGGAETSKAPLRRQVELLQKHKKPRGERGHKPMTTFDDLYCAHLEQLRMRYPDAYHIRPAWGVDLRRIESKVVIADGTQIFISVMTPEGRIRHFAENYKIARWRGLFERAIPPQPSYGQD